MRKITIVIIGFLLSPVVHAQLIDNKLNIYSSYSFGNFMGSKTINEDNYIAPSLYPNFNSVSGFSLKVVMNSKDYLSFGMNYDYQFADQWNLSDYSDFKDAEIHLHSVTPLVRIHNKFNDKGILNRLQFFLECGPTIGISSLNFSQPLFEIQPNENNISPPMSDHNFFGGLKGTIGMECSFTQRLGLFFSYSYDMDWVSSKLHSDNLMKCSTVNVGLVLKFNKNKYFYY